MDLTVKEDQVKIIRSEWIDAFVGVTDTDNRMPQNFSTPSPMLVSYRSACRTSHMSVWFKSKLLFWMFRLADVDPQNLVHLIAKSKMTKLETLELRLSSGADSNRCISDKQEKGLEIARTILKSRRASGDGREICVKVVYSDFQGDVEQWYIWNMFQFFCLSSPGERNNTWAGTSWLAALCFPRRRANSKLINWLFKTCKFIVLYAEQPISRYKDNLVSLQCILVEERLHVNVSFIDCNTNLYVQMVVLQCQNSLEEARKSSGMGEVRDVHEIPILDLEIITSAKLENAEPRWKLRRIE